MKFDIYKINGSKIAEIVSEDIEISNSQDALDMMADFFNQGIKKIILKENNIIPDFFNLKTGLAGDILQKFTNYNFIIAVVGDFSKYSGKSIKDFIFESNKTGKIIFVNSSDEAKEKLSAK